MRRILEIAACVLLAACAKGAGVDDGSDDPVGDAGREGGVSLPPVDGGVTPPPTDSGGGGGCGAAAVCDGKVVINEVMTAGQSASDEFIELYNPTGCAITLTGWKLGYRSGGNGAGPDLYNFPAGSSIAAQSFLVIAGAGFRGRKDAQFAAGSLAAGDGQVGLLDDNLKLIDAVGYGTASGSYTEGRAAPGPAANGSVGRDACGVDTNSNSSDFKLFATPSAGAPN